MKDIALVAGYLIITTFMFIPSIVLCFAWSEYDCETVAKIFGCITIVEILVVAFGLFYGGIQICI